MPIIRWFDKLATVYAEADNYAAAVKTDLACGLFHLNVSAPSTGTERAELLALRRLLWDPAYQMPESSQVEVDGIRWQTERGTFGLVMHRNTNTPAYRACDVLRVS